MMTSSIDQCRLLLSMARPVLARLTDAHRALEPAPGAKTAGWLVGHLSVTGDFARHLCGARALCPREWRSAFNPGTFPSADPGSYPPMSVLSATCIAVYDDLCTTAMRTDSELLARRNPYEPARDDFRTAGDFVAYVASGHLAYHLGQLTTWCAAANVNTR